MRKTKERKKEKEMNYTEFKAKAKEFTEQAFINLNNLTELIQVYDEQLNQEAKPGNSEQVASIEEFRKLLQAYNIMNIYEKKSVASLYNEVINNKLTALQIEQVCIKVNEYKNKGKIDNIKGYVRNCLINKRIEDIKRGIINE